MTRNCQGAGHKLIIILIFSLQAKSSCNSGTSHQWASKDSVFLILIVLRPKGLSSEVTVSGYCSSSVDNLCMWVFALITKIFLLRLCMPVLKLHRGTFFRRGLDRASRSISSSVSESSCETLDSAHIWSQITFMKWNRWRFKGENRIEFLRIISSPFKRIH